MTREREPQPDSPEALERLRGRARLGWWVVGLLLALAVFSMAVAPVWTITFGLVGALAVRWTLRRSNRADDMAERLRTSLCFACGYDCSDLPIREHPMCPECGAVRGSTIRAPRP